MQIFCRQSVWDCYTIWKVRRILLAIIIIYFIRVTVEIKIVINVTINNKGLLELTLFEISNSSCFFNGSMPNSAHIPRRSKDKKKRRRFVSKSCAYIFNSTLLHLSKKSTIVTEDLACFEDGKIKKENVHRPVTKIGENLIIERLTNNLCLNYELTLIVIVL